MSLAIIKLSQNEFAAAEEILNEAVAKAPLSVEARIGLSELYGALHKLDDAKRSIRRALEIDPRSGTALLFLARVQQAKGQEAQIMVHYVVIICWDATCWLMASVKKRGLHFGGPKPPIRTSGPRILPWCKLDRSSGNTEAARKTLLEVLGSKRTNRKGKLIARLMMGDLEGAAGNHAAQIEQWHKVVAADNRNVFALNNLAYSLPSMHNSRTRR